MFRDKNILRSWLALFTNLISLVIILPIVVTKFTVEQISLWYSVLAIYSLIQLAEFGFTPTLTRLYAQSERFCYVNDFFRYNKLDTDNVDDEKIFSHSLNYIIENVYLFLSLISFLLTYFLYYFFVGVEDLVENFFILYVALSNAFFIYSQSKVVKLNGLGKIYISQDSYTLSSLLSSVLVLACFYFSENVLILLSLYMSRNFIIYLYLRINGGNIISNEKENSSLLSKYVFQMATKAGFGTLLSLGVFRSSMLIMNKFYPNVAAFYGVAQQIQRAMTNFCQVPFYSYIPKLADLFLADRSRFVCEVKKRLLTCIVLFTVGTAIIYLFYILEVLPKDMEVKFDPYVWLLLSFILIGERFSGILIQTYTFTNDVIWHRVSGSYVISFLLSFIAVSDYSEYAVLYSILFSTLIVSVPMSLYYSRRVIPKYEFFMMLFIYLLLNSLMLFVGML